MLRERGKKSILLKCSQTAVCLSKTLLGIITECEHLSFLTNRKCMLHYLYVNQSDSINFMVFNSSPPPAESFAHPKLWILKGTWLRRRKKNVSACMNSLVNSFGGRYLRDLWSMSWPLSDLDKWLKPPAAGRAPSCFHVSVFCWQHKWIFFCMHWHLYISWAGRK